MPIVDEEREPYDVLGYDRLIEWGVPAEVDEREFEEIAPDGFEGALVPEEIVGRETDGEKVRLDGLVVRLPIEGYEPLLDVPEDGDRRMIAGDVPLVPPVVEEDKGRRIVVEDRGFARVIDGVERVLLIAEELGVLGRRVTMVGEDRDVRELLEGALYEGVL